MPTATGENRCATCGRDVSNTERAKDDAGNYYCPTCPLPPTPVPSDAPRADTRCCANCGNPFGALERGISWDGVRVCARCNEALQVEARERDKEVAEAAKRAAADERERSANAAAEARRQRRLDEARRQRAAWAVAAKWSAAFTAASLIAFLVRFGAEDFLAFMSPVAAVVGGMFCTGSIAASRTYARTVKRAEGGGTVETANWFTRTFRRRCPKCKSYGCVKSRTRQAGSKTVRRREMRTATHTDAGRVKITGATNYEVDVAREVPIFQTTCTCRECGHSWTY